MAHPTRIATTRLLDGSTIIIKHGEEGFYTLPTFDWAGKTPAEINKIIEKAEGCEITPELVKVYECASMFGWDIPAAADYK